MNNLLGPILAIASTIVLLLLRELLLSVGKKKRNYGAVDPQVSNAGAEIQPDRSPYEDTMAEFEGPVPQATPIAVDEFLAELRARAQEQATSRIKDGATTDFARGQSNRQEMTEDLW